MGQLALVDAQFVCYTSTMVDSIFTKIVKGDAPCFKVYEDDRTLAFLTIEPFVPGHTLVIPKVQVENFDDLAPVDYEAVFRTVQLVTKRLKAAFAVDKVAVLIFGFDVPHVHVHLVPVADHDEFTSALAAHITKQKLRLYAPTDDELERVAEKINSEEL